MAVILLPPWDHGVFCGMTIPQIDGMEESHGIFHQNWLRWLSSTNPSEKSISVVSWDDEIPNCSSHHQPDNHVFC
jgi:hypothetical protein